MNANNYLILGSNGKFVNSSDLKDNTVKKPILKYFGGKWRLAPWIIKHMPTHARYVEPFSGAASVLLRKKPCKIEVLNDKYDRLVNVFRVLRDTEKAQELKRLLSLTPYSKSEYRACFWQSDDEIEDARRMFVLSFQGMGGDSFRERNGWKRGFGKTSIKNDRPYWYDFSSYIDAWHQRLHYVMIEQDNALNVIRHYDSPETLFYVDPPYVFSTRRKKSNYHYELDDAAHVELAHVLHEVKGMIILSGYSSELYDNLYKDWIRIDKSTRDVRNNRKIESLWLSPNIRLLTDINAQ